MSRDRFATVERIAARSAVGVMIAATASAAGLVALGDSRGAGSATLGGLLLGGALVMTSFAAFGKQVR